MSLQQESLPTSNHQAAITLKTALETQTSSQMASLSKKNKNKVKGTGLAYYFVD